MYCFAEVVFIYEKLVKSLQIDNAEYINLRSHSVEFGKLEKEPSGFWYFLTHLSTASESTLSTAPNIVSELSAEKMNTMCPSSYFDVR
jgi:hypothetical protein